MRIFHPDWYPYVQVVEVEKKELDRIDMEICKQPSETLRDFYDRQSVKPDLLINGGFFAMADGATCFHYIDDYEEVAKSQDFAYGIGVIDEKLLQYGHVDSRSDWRDFVSAYPPLVVANRAPAISCAKELDYRARRSVLGYSATHVFLVTVELPGLGFAELQRLLLMIGCEYAINLDGGRSTKVLYRGESITEDRYNRAVDNVIAFYLKDKPLYRVQAGAFSKLDNAERLRAAIQTIPDAIGAGYQRAFICKTNDLYKVQIGAFGKKENAQKVVEDLKRHGHSSFISG